MTTREADGLNDDVESERIFVFVAYVLHLAGSFVALPSIAGLVVNYLKRSDAGDLFATHHAWMIRTFWWALAWFLIGFFTKPVGWAVLALAWIWYVYRQLLGLIRLANGDSMVDPMSRSMAL
ncbi:MAG TPA: hypothetical protein VFV10_15965 [Gammaproteobacteria bacterium]|nr:hypothetical protein [Gammaproteobacteria bacterium]